VLLSRVAYCALVAASLAVAGCDNNPKSAADAAASVSPDKVSAEELQSLVTDPAAKSFYEARGWQAAWTDERAKELADAIGEADRHAIDRAKLLKEAAKDAGPAAREVALTEAALTYAGALSNGIVDPKKIFEVYEIPMPKVDLVKGLQDAVEGGNVGEWLRGLAPQDEEYKALSDAYVRYRNAAPREGSRPIEPGKTIHPGARDPRVPLIETALRSTGYLPAAQAEAQKPAQPAPAAKPSTVYRRDLAAGVAKLQADYGIDADGVIGNSTIEALNNGATARARILAVNLERRRWLERSQPGTRIDVNTAGAFLRYWRDGSLSHEARVVVGQPDWETPEIASPMARLVANPPWTVPDTIAEKEILPKGPGYMAAQNMHMENGRIVQESGPKSALGLVKFDLLNKHAIYLHDTPAKALFATNDRHSSHGCARVQDALGFARLIADQEGKRDQFEKALASGKESSVVLGTRIPVRFLYHTAYLDGGRVVFRPDPYGWDEKLAAALGFKGQLRRVVVKHIEDTGP